MKLVRLNESLSAAINLEESIKNQLNGLKESKSKNANAIRIEAIHEIVTENNIRYPADKLRGDSEFVKEGSRSPTGAYSWTRPYPKPMITNHDVYSKPLGRIIDASFIESSTIGVPGIEVTVSIADKEAIEMVQDGRYYSVSIGATTDGLYCNICGQNKLEENDCNHWKGKTYEGKKCYWSIGNIWFEELSFVNVPADGNARVIDVGKVPKPEHRSESSDEIFVIDEEAETIKKLSESKKEATSLQDQGNIDVTSKEQEEVSALEDSSSTVETDSTAEEISLEDKISSLEESLNQLNKSQATILETLLNIVKEAGLLEDQEDVANSEDTSAEVIAELQVKIDALEAEIETLRAEKKEITDQAVELQSKIRQGLIEKVVSLKIGLGLISEESRDEEIKAHASRSEESLLDTLSDLERGKDSGKHHAPREKNVVKNPGLAVNSEKGVLEIDSDGAVVAHKDKELTASSVIKNLLTGKKDK